MLYVWGSRLLIFRLSYIPRYKAMRNVKLGRLFYSLRHHLPYYTFSQTLARRFFCFVCFYYSVHTRLNGKNPEWNLFYMNNVYFKIILFLSISLSVMFLTVLCGIWFFEKSTARLPRRYSIISLSHANTEC